MADQTFPGAEGSIPSQFHGVRFTSVYFAAFDFEKPFLEVYADVYDSNEDFIDVGETHHYDVACEDRDADEYPFSLSLSVYKWLSMFESPYCQKLIDLSGLNLLMKITVKSLTEVKYRLDLWCYP